LKFTARTTAANSSGTAVPYTFTTAAKSRIYAAHF